MKKRVLWRYSFILFLVVMGLTVTILKYEPIITGNAVYEQVSKEKNWTFAISSDYTYDNSSLNISNGNVELAPKITTTYWNTTTETEYALTAALYNSSDKTTKVNTLDDDKHQVKDNKIFDIFFPEKLNNNDTISLYIKNGKQGDIYLCDKGTICNAPGYGLINYNSEGWYNITISGINAATKVLNLVVAEKANLDYITSTQGEIIKALYNPSDKTTKVNLLDNKEQEIKKNEMFNILFNNTIDDNDVISIYIKSGNETDLFLCEYGHGCNFPGYGFVHYEGEEEGWYNITVENLNSSTNSFNLDPDKVNIDYIKATYREVNQHNYTNRTYLPSAEIETKDFQPLNWKEWNLFSHTEVLNGQNITYYYSTNSGMSWISLLDNDLSSINSSKIRFKAILISNQTATPILNNLKLTYTTQTCIENWTIQYGTCLINDRKLKYYQEINECGTTNNLPDDNGTYVSCDYCQINNCSNSFQNTTLSSQNRTINVDAFNKTKLEIKLNKDVGESFVSIVERSTHAKNSSPSAVSVNRYLDIESNLTNISSVKITVYYTAEEINKANINEESLKIHYYNETSGKWKELNSTVNSTENYVSTTVNHLSLYGLFGQEESSGSSSGKGKSLNKEEDGESSSTETTNNNEEVIIVTETSSETKTEPIAYLEEDISKSKTCDYVLEILLPDEISLVEEDSFKGEITNKGNCEIQELQLYINSDLERVIDLPVSLLENIQQGNKTNFVLIRRQEEKKGSWFSFVTSSAITSTVIRSKTVTGSLLIEGIVDQEIIFKRELPLNIKVKDFKTRMNRNFVGLASTLLVLIASLIIKRKDKIRKFIHKKYYSK